MSEGIERLSGRQRKVGSKVSTLDSLQGRSIKVQVGKDRSGATLGGD